MDKINSLQKLTSPCIEQAGKERGKFRKFKKEKPNKTTLCS